MFMLKAFFRMLFIPFVLILPFQTSNANDLIQVDSRDGVVQRGLFIEAEDATHTVLLFPGGNGLVKLKDDGTIRKKNGNFVVRTRDLLLDNGMNVVIVDAPSDRYNRRGMKGGYRSSEDHIIDLTALIGKVKEISDLPIWLNGTSRGSESVAYAGIHLKGINGLILTSSITVENGNGKEITSYALEKITLPVFVGAHENDGCWVTPPDGAERIKNKLTNAKAIEYKMYSGGDDPISKPCKAKSEHGFLGIEHQVLMDMIKFIKAN